MFADQLAQHHEMCTRKFSFSVFPPLQHDESGGDFQNSLQKQTLQYQCQGKIQLQ
uniref:Uncharacterized protein n=1 Tax=Cyanothece sp. (strain PCC 7425 / ATCC 29141) TaxID=395961 RepID=B8HXN6_CYAP4